MPARSLNLRFIGHLLSLIVMALGVGILASAFVSLFYEHPDLPALLASTAVCLAVGIPVFLATRLGGHTTIGYREGFLITGLGWIVAMIFGALPYLIYGMFSPIDALFEAMSGFTTTGASVLQNFDQPRGLMFWRSLTHWYGGMGIIVLFVAVLPSLGGGAIRLFSAEAPGPVPERLTPKIRDTAKGLWLIYVGISAAEMLALRGAGLDLYDAITHTFGTMATGGFSPRAESIAAYDMWHVELIIVFFMVLAGANFALYFAVLSGQTRRLLRDPELRLYLAMLLGGVVAVATSLMLAGPHEEIIGALRDATFQVVSIQTTTGYVTADFDQWNTFAKAYLVVIMFVGGSAGSTAGGIKVARVLLLAKNAHHEITRQAHPRAVLPVKIGGRVISEDVRMAVLGFFSIHVAVFVGGTLAMAMTNVDIVSAVASVAATLNNIGPGLEVVGPTLNYAPIHASGKIILITLMLMGRLELYAVLLPFTRRFWNR